MTTQLSTREQFPAPLFTPTPQAARRMLEFFTAQINNPHTRRAYARIVGRFLAWCEEQGIELRQITPGLAWRFIEEIPGSDPTKNLALFSSNDWSEESRQVSASSRTLPRS